MNFTNLKNPEKNVFSRKSRSLTCSLEAATSLAGGIHEKIFECKTLIKSFPKEEIRRILQESIGSKNMLKLFAMMEFLEIKNGRRASEDFIKNVILLSLLYGSRRSKRSIAFVDLVFQALYRTLSKDDRY